MSIKGHWLNGDELADHLAISPGMVRKLLHQGMPSMTIGRARRYDADACIAWLQRQSDAA